MSALLTLTGSIVILRGPGLIKNPTESAGDSGLSTGLKQLYKLLNRRQRLFSAGLPLLCPAHALGPESSA